MLDWLLIGGGIHGTYLSHALLRRAGASADRLRVLDPHAAPLAAWDRCAEAVGMDYLRSPAVHHLDLDPYSLRRFAQRAPGRRLARFVAPYDRPGLGFFRAHARWVIEAHRLEALRVRGRARALKAAPGGYRVETDEGAIEARRVVLAMGPGEAPSFPGWAREAQEAGLRVDHVFAEGFSRAAIPSTERVAVVGGGLSAAQLALALAAGAPGRVTLLMRHPLRVHQFDSDPGWLGPRYMAGFAKTRDAAARRARIAAGRHRGSVPPELAGRLARAVETGALRRVEAEVTGAARREDGAMALATREGETAVVDRVILATGFEAGRPGGAWLGEAIEALGLPCAACGFPLAREDLSWGPGLFVTGALAELELGPVARNIAGAQRAGDRLARAA